MGVGSVTGDRYLRRVRRWPAAAVLTLALTLGASCGGAASNQTGDGEVVVMAASSLSDVIERLLEDGTGITPVLAGSSTLVAQLSAGAHADVLITANAATMDRATSDGSVQGTPVVIATNALVLATAPGNPGRVSGLADLARPDLLIGLCSAEVPCGALARQALGGAQIAPSVDTLELSVRALATKLSLGELDAGLIYSTDAGTAGLPVVGAPELDGHVNRYHIASVSDDPRPEVLEVINDFAESGKPGSDALHAHGFGQP